MTDFMTRLRAPFLFIVFLVLAAIAAGQGPAFAQKKKEEEAKSEGQADPLAEPIRRAWKGTVLRFVTESDYPPFNYYDEEGVLTGFNVDLARAICVQMEVRCEIQTAEWEELVPKLNKSEADVVAASMRISVANLKSVDFTNRYFQVPARFASRKSYDLDVVIPEEVEGEKIGVAKGTAHEAYLKDFFYDADIVSFSSAAEARAALKDGKVALLFGDGVSLMFWVNGLDSAGCCTLRGGAFTEAKYFGEGIGLAVKKGNRALREVLNEALEDVRKSGRFEELYLRYFPLRFY